MKSKFLVLALLVACAFIVPQKAVAQGTWSDKVSWTYKLQKIDDKTAYVIGTAKLVPGWHIFCLKLAEPSK